MIEITAVTAGYGRKEVLRGVDMKIPQGGVTTVIGSNGSGKSTLLRAMLGLIPLTGGDIKVDGISVSRMSRGEIARKIAYLPQGKNIPDISAGRMVLHGRFPYLSYPRRYGEKDFRIAEEAMEQMGIRELSESPMRQLSGGMRQKIYIAMALAQQAGVILMDEPTTYLDIGQQFRFARIAGMLSKEGKTVVLVLHDILLALKISDRMAALQDGKLIRYGTPEEILESGVLQEMYGVGIKAVASETGRQYCYDDSSLPYDAVFPEKKQ